MKHLDEMDEDEIQEAIEAGDIELDDNGWPSVIPYDSYP
jgi:hypothetical protein